MTPLSRSARRYRQAARAMTIAPVLALAGIVGWARGAVPVSLGAAAVALLVVASPLAIGLGVRARRRAVADHEQQERLAMLVAISAQLRGQDDDALRRMVDRGGPAAEAAALLLQGRRERAAES